MCGADFSAKKILFIIKLRTGYGAFFVWLRLTVRETKKKEGFMALSLVEYMRSQQVMDPRLPGVIKVFTKNAPILGDAQNLGIGLPALKWVNSVGGVVSWTRQVSLPTAAFRALNSEYDASEGVTEKKTEDLKLIGARIEVDRALEPRGNGQGIVEQQIMQVAALARKWNETFYKGDGEDNTFTGLQERIDGDQEVDNEGAGLDLYKLDKMILELRGDDPVIVMGTGLAAWLFKAAKEQTNIQYAPAQFGVSPATYNGIPIMLAGEDASEDEILDFSEAGTTTSLYLLSLDTERGVVGAQTQPLQVLDYDQNKVDQSYLVEWDNNFMIKTKRSAYRLKSIANVAVGADAPSSS